MIFGNPFDAFGLEGVTGQDYISVGFQLTFAVITAALISGAIADRVKFSAWMVFLPLWVTLSYFPLAHMVWGGGFRRLRRDGISGLLFDGDAARRSTTRAARSSTSTPVWPAWCSRSCSASASASARSRCGRTT